MNHFNLGYSDLIKQSLWHRIKASLRRQARTTANTGDWLTFIACVIAGCIIGVILR